ncbi:beta-galactosidase [Longispora fulva]|uniref:Beta-galactosidase n=1 Tax=Longispora fulva TaxID=619741 RepID=A0A8J7GRQ6_9ACTN|nr:beta-galactosidase [Longispora fulva]MBG6136993.1 beta-galactosidase [Longispora fulva]GIG61654.1 beta-galactosidase [Longispora fulva]
MAHRWLRWPHPHNPIAYGADYNPEQWSPRTWREDVALMREASVNIVNLGIFSWAEVRPAPDEWRWDWLDEILDLLHDNGIAVDLGTGTASPPPWLTTLHPEILPVTADGRTLGPGGRQHWRPTSPVFRRYALEHVRAVADRYGAHPGLAMWHVSNELGCHNALDYSDDAAAAFRTWLRARYDTLDALNTAWGTAFWSQRYSAWEQILPPRLAASYPNPAQQLDFHRFSSDALREHLRAEAAVLRELTPDIPVTTNFMVMGDTRNMDYAGWRHDVDLVSNDHYLTGARPDAFEELCFSANLVRGLADSAPWFLMEQSTSAVNWQPVNHAKAPGQLARDSLAHLAHGADAISFFQWRQSTAGAEKYHSAMLPHAGTRSRLWRDVRDLGATLRELGEVAGSRAAPSSVAVLFDWESWWSSELDSHPSELFRYRELALDWYKAFEALGIATDVQPVDADLTGYRMVVAPGLHLVPADLAARITAHVDGGGHFVTTFFSGIVDENDRVLTGGYPGAFRDLLGVRVEEFAPLAPGAVAALDRAGHGTLWTEHIAVDPGVDVLVRFADGDLAGLPAATRRPVGTGSAAYAGTRLDPVALRALVGDLSGRAGLGPDLDPAAAPAVVRRVRQTDTTRYVFLVNRTREARTVTAEHGYDLLGRREVTGSLDLAPLGVAVLRQPRPIDHDECSLGTELIQKTS